MNNCDCHCKSELEKLSKENSSTQKMLSEIRKTLDGYLLKSKGLLDGRHTSGERKRFWRGVRLVPEYLLEMEQSTID